MTKIFSVIIFSTIIVHSFAQAPYGRITGTVNDSTGKAIESMTIVLLKTIDSTVAKTAMSNNVGEYDFSNIKYGQYLVSINGTGYRSYSSAIIFLDSLHDHVSLPAISLQLATKTLSAVTVTAQKPFIERKIDKLVVNVGSSPANTGRSAFEVLEKLPGILVDQDDNINMNGKQGIIVLIEGKQSYLAGKDLANYLRGIPAAQLDQIEISTQPSAKYDAAGNAGIINFKMKKSESDGFNGNITPSVIFGVFVKTRNAIQLNWKKNKLNISLNYGFSYSKTNNNQNTIRYFRKNESSFYSSYLQQDIYFVHANSGHNTRITADYQVSGKTSLGFSVSSNFNNSNRVINSLSYLSDSSHNQTQYTLSITDLKFKGNSLASNLNVLHKIDPKGKEITADVDYVIYHYSNNQKNENYFNPATGTAIPPYLLNVYTPTLVKIFSIKSDYTRPIPSNAKIEAGVKTSFVNTDNFGHYTLFNSQQMQWLNDTNQTNHFIYKENINAVYLNFSKQVNKKWSYQLGLRFEQTISAGDQLTRSEKFEKHFAQIFPTAYVSYTPNDNNSYTLSFGRRISRAGYQDLNPFRVYVDNYFLLQGNPGLKSMFTNNIEAGYHYKGQLNLLFNYTKTTGVFNITYDNIQQGSDNLIVQIKRNLGFRRNIGMSIDYRKPIAKWFITNLSLNIFNNLFSGAPGTITNTINTTACNFNFSNQFIFKKGWACELSGFYRSKQLTGFITVLPFGSFSVATTKKILKNQGIVTININDPFKFYRVDNYIEQTTFYTKTYNVPEFRSLTVSLNYKFGKAVQQQRKRNTGSSQDEQNRVGL